MWGTKKAPRVWRDGRAFEKIDVSIQALAGRVSADKNAFGQKMNAWHRSKA